MQIGCIVPLNASLESGLEAKQGAGGQRIGGPCEDIQIIEYQFLFE